MTIVVASRAGANVEASDEWLPDIVDFGALPALASNSGPYGFVKILRALCPTESGEVAMRGVIDDLQRGEISMYRAIHLDGTPRRCRGAQVTTRRSKACVTSRVFLGPEPA